MTLIVHARYATGTPEELDTLGTPDHRTLAGLDHDDAGDWKRADRRDRLTLSELYEELSPIIDALNKATDEKGDSVYALDYFSRMYQYDAQLPAHVLKARPIPPLTGHTKLADVRYRWIAVYPVTGGSEGHYIHVDLLWQDDGKEGRISLFLGKTFGGHAAACAIAAVLARVLGV